MARASQLAISNDAGHARRDALRPKLAANLLPRRPLDLRQSHGAARHFKRTCHADGIESRWHRGDDRGRNTAELNQYQTQAAIVIIGHCDRTHAVRGTTSALSAHDLNCNDRSSRNLDCWPE